MVSHKVGAKLSARAALSSEGLTGEVLLLSSFMWLLIGFSFSRAVGLRVSVPCWL